MRYLLISMLILFISSCNLKTRSTCSINFQGEKINFPIKAAEIKSLLFLEYKPYIGFHREDADGTLIATQIRGHKMFPGTDRSKEENYWNKEVVGIVKFIPRSLIDFDTLKNNLELEYNVSFENQKEVKEKLKEKERNWYYLAKVNPCLWLTFNKNKHYYIFSIYNIPKRKIDKYLMR